MADYQVLPPGLRATGTDPCDFQMNGEFSLHVTRSTILSLCVEPLDLNFCNRDIPSFLPPNCFSKFDKPLDNYSYVLCSSLCVLQCWIRVTARQLGMHAAMLQYAVVLQCWLLVVHAVLLQCGC